MLAASSGSGDIFFGSRPRSDIMALRAVSSVSIRRAQAVWSRSSSTSVCKKLRGFWSASAICHLISTGGLQFVFGFRLQRGAQRYDVDGVRLAPRGVGRLRVRGEQRLRDINDLFG